MATVLSSAGKNMIVAVVQSFNQVSRTRALYFLPIFLLIIFPLYPTVFQFYKTLHEHIGEAEAIESDGSCSNPYLIPSNDKKSCVLPGRIDVARHFMLYGGVSGLKERYEDSTSRLQSFGRYMFNLTEYPIVQQLFDSELFKSSAKTVCPKGKQYLDPFQFNFITQVR
jgi:hypothetical protein